MEKIITILVMMLLISTAAISIANESNIENKLSEELNEEIENDIAFSKALFPNIPRILNMDWNYWVNKPNLFLIPTGNVGIGTENPTEKLDVDGNVKVTGFKMNTGATDGFVLTSDANGVGSWQQGTPGPQGPPGEGDGHSLDSMDGSLIDVVYVNDEGHVGIGTTDPIADLEIENGGNTFLLIDELSGFSWTGLRFDRNNIEKWFIGMSNTDNNLLIRRTASNNDMVINTVGNVGIGTIEPDEKLHVSGGYIKTDSGYGYKLEHDNGYSSARMQKYRYQTAQTSDRLNLKTNSGHHRSQRYLAVYCREKKRDRAHLHIQFARDSLSRQSFSGGGCHAFLYKRQCTLANR